MSEENEKTEPQQHPLIHSTPDLPAPEDSLQTFMGDTPKKRMARKKAEMAVRARLESLDARTMSFNGKGTVPLTLMIDGEEVEKDLPIKTIPAYIMADISRDYQVCATSIPRRWNPDAGRREAALALFYSAGRCFGGPAAAPDHTLYMPSAIGPFPIAYRRAAHSLWRSFQTAFSERRDPEAERQTAFPSAVRKADCNQRFSPNLFPLKHSRREPTGLLE